MSQQVSSLDKFSKQFSQVCAFNALTKILTQPLEQQFYIVNLTKTLTCTNQYFNHTIVHALTTKKRLSPTAEQQNRPEMVEIRSEIISSTVFWSVKHRRKK